MTEPTAATSAVFAPDRPETRYMLSTMTWRSPPRRCPTSACTKRTSRSEMPPRSMMRPARMKNGSASRTKLPVPSTMFCGSATIGTVSAVHRYTAVLNSNAKPIGRPPKMVRKNSASAAVMAPSPVNQGSHAGRVAKASASTPAKPAPTP